MKTLLQKLCYGIFLGTALLSAHTAMAQIEYQEDFTGSHGWHSNTFETTSIAACEGTDALRARVNNLLIAQLPAVAVSPPIGTSNGEEVELSYQYRLLNYDAILPIIPVDLIDFGALTLQYATSVNGPWADIDNISLPEYTGSANCTTRIVSFTPPAGSTIFLRFRANLGLALNLDYFVYIDGISVMQDVLSVQERTFSNKVVAHPNPVLDYLTLNYDGFINNVSIFNMQGQEVQAIAMDNDLRRLDMTGLADGPYILKVSADTGTETINIVKD